MTSKSLRMSPRTLMVALAAAVLAMVGAWYWHEGGKR